MGADITPERLGVCAKPAIYLNARDRIGPQEVCVS